MLVRVLVPSRVATDSRRAMSPEAMLADVARRGGRAMHGNPLI